MNATSVTRDAKERPRTAERALAAVRISSNRVTVKYLNIDSYRYFVHILH